jgi:hypothetical protein
MKEILKNKEMNEFANLLLENGFRLLIYKPECSWFKYEKDGKIGYVQLDRYNSTFSSVNKPCKECGTGFRVSGDYAELTIENALKAFYMPQWAISQYRSFVKPYKNLEEIRDNDKILKYYIVE